MKSSTFLIMKNVAYSILLSGTLVCGSTKKIALKSIQYHPGSSKQLAALELGTMVLFFSEPVFPVLVHKKNISDKKIEQRIMFPGVLLIDDQVKNMIMHINDQKTDGYSITFVPAQDSMGGLELFITYDQQQVLYNYETTVSSVALPGCIFRFINQLCYNDLVKKVKEQGITHTAWQKKNLLLSSTLGMAEMM